MYRVWIVGWAVDGMGMGTSFNVSYGGGREKYKEQWLDPNLSLFFCP